MSTKNKHIVRRLYEEVWNERKLDVVDELISPSRALHDPNVSGSQIGPDAYKQQVAPFTTAFPDLHFAIEDIFSEKDKLVVSWMISGTHKGEYEGIPPTDKKISVDGITINYLANGKILDSYVSWDALGLMRQLGHSRRNEWPYLEPGRGVIFPLPRSPDPASSGSVLRCSLLNG
jgi:steroid delta-isomerase-like uncharacterized protein